MFDPSKAKEDKAAKAAKRKAITDLMTWSGTIVPIELREGMSEIV